MKKRYCPECGGELILVRETPNRAWTIEENEFKRADNNIFDGPALIFYCQNDMEHDIGDDESFGKWGDEIIEQWEKKIMPYI